MQRLKFRNGISRCKWLVHLKEGACQEVRASMMSSALYRQRFTGGYSACRVDNVFRCPVKAPTAQDAFRADTRVLVTSGSFSMANSAPPHGHGVMSRMTKN